MKEEIKNESNLGVLQEKYKILRGILEIEIEKEAKKYEGADENPHP